MEEVGFDELFYQLRKCHHKAVELNECQEVIMARHLLDHCVIYLKPAKNTEQHLQPENVLPVCWNENCPKWNEDICQSPGKCIEDVSG